jgi:DNA-3-methyladenine glycosylase
MGRSSAREVDVTPPRSGAWRSSFGGGPSREWFRRPVPEVARALLGQRVVSEVEGTRTSGRIIETEAYLGEEDPASHAAVRAGRTHRNASMFEAGGHAYLYFTYGMHWCLNVVTGARGEAGAVLVRALEPVEGLEAMQRRREGRAPLTAGPARLCQALGLDGSLDGHRLDRSPLRIEFDRAVSDAEVGVSVRIGIRKATEWPLRWFVRGHPDLSRHGLPEGSAEAMPPSVRDALPTLPRTPEDRPE